MFDQSVLPMKMPSVAVTLKKYVDAQGECMILIRLTHERKVAYKSLGIKAKPKDFKKKPFGFNYVQTNDPYSETKNNTIRKEVERIMKALYGKREDGIISIDTAFAILDNSYSTSMFMYQLGGDYLSQRITNDGTHRRWEYCRQLIKEYDEGLTVLNITPKWLTQFEAYLSKHYKDSNSKLTPLKYLRAVVNYAMSIGIDVDYPFGVGKYRFPKEQKTIRNYLTQGDLQKLKVFLLESPDDSLKVTGAWFLLQCYSGMRYSDIEKFNLGFIRENKLYFSDKKTNTPHFIPISADLQKALQFVENKPKQAYENYKRKLATIGSAIKLNFPLTTHVGRHTFAVSYLEDGGNIFYLQKLLGHADIKTTMIYLQSTNRGIEDDMKRVQAHRASHLSLPDVTHLK